MLTQRCRRAPIITSALGHSVSYYLGSGLFGVGVRKRHPHCYAAVPQKHGTITRGSTPKTRDDHPLLFQCWASIVGCSSTLKQHWVNGMCLLICWRKVYSRPSVGLVLWQHRRRLTIIEPAMGCAAGPTLNRNWVGRPTSCVRV